MTPYFPESWRSRSDDTGEKGGVSSVSGVSESGPWDDFSFEELLPRNLMEQCDPDSPFEKPFETQETPATDASVSQVAVERSTLGPGGSSSNGTKHSKLQKHLEILRYRETIFHLGKTAEVQIEAQRLSPIVRFFTLAQIERVDTLDQLFRKAIEVGQLFALRKTQQLWERVWRETREEATVWFRDQLENAKEPSPKLIGHWDEDAIARALENRKSVPVWSSILRQWVIWVKGDEEKKALEKTGPKVPVFTLEELRIMTQAKWDAEHLKRVTAIKRELGGTIQHSSTIGKREWEGKPGMRGGTE